LDYTTVGNAVILTNTQSLILLAGKFFIGDSVLPMEAIGAIGAFIGAFLCSKDAAFIDGTAGDESWKGNMYGILTAFLEVGYLVLAIKATRPHACQYVFMFLATFVGTKNVLLVMDLLDVDISFGLDPDTGLFGWIDIQSSHR
jgi:drug/metabolite transporter (DMT)-like permease